MDGEDTELLLGMLSSLLDEPLPDQAALMDALVAADGDIASATNALKRPRPSRVAESPSWNKKRRRESETVSSTLKNWLQPTSASTSGSSHEDDRSTLLEPEPGVPGPSPLKVVTAESGSSKRGGNDAMMSANETRQSSLKKSAILYTALLKNPAPSPPAIIRQAPLTLGTCELVAKHTPCTLHLSILPPELACKLFYTMLDASRNWARNKWWLFDRIVESPHRTSFYARKNDGVGGKDNWQEAARFWYNGRQTDPPHIFPPEMEEACQYVEETVNNEIRKRHRFPLEWGGHQIWKANVAASNCYEGAKETVGFHSDQLTYLGPFPTIASISLGTQRIFRLREVIPKEDDRHPRTFNIPLPHNSLVIMHAATQEKFKHAVPPQPVIDIHHPKYPQNPNKDIQPSNCRINITFRFYRPDFSPESIPKCHCGVPTILRPDMKNRPEAGRESEFKYWWTCYAAAQNDRKGCNFWRVMDMKAEGRGPCINDTKPGNEV